ncbi:type IV pilus biogenesis/stability protein PilW [Thiopseudomonas alkaliphila]|uniref:Type IV pilus biogenesis/stability protein PilW n=1 Tax=Thiopseudomonas alkaliphila TaxID=1697053 RepID=A0AAW7DNQ7_9GAMM|nr:type IV pilus biogenesis/stability protein PilW [Thiopseudomonas alkaliphila]MDM1695326.1 type IV pilus biogenesis/stability protein PilW [Thiopseudomonas alkaliphila]
MKVRKGLSTVLAALWLTACVSSGNGNPLKSSSGREQAVDAYVQLGIGYLQDGLTEQAKVPLKKALEIDPKSAHAHGTLAYVFQQEMEYELAEQHFLKAIAQDRSPRMLNNYGSFLYERKQYAKAYKLFTEAAKDTMYPERSRVFENLGLTASKLGNSSEAEHYLARSLRLNPEQPRASLELATLLFEQQQYVPAQKNYENFQRFGEQNPQSLLLGIRLARIFNDHSQAASLELQLRRLYPASAEYKQYQREHL